jgi:NAD(P) transhydrogenase subunit alpha
VPETVAKLTAAGFELIVERGAGVHAGFHDELYADAGARLADFPGLFDGAEGVVHVGSPGADEVGAYTQGTVLVGFLQPLTDQAGIARLRERGVVAFAMESIPRHPRGSSPRGCDASGDPSWRQ